MFGLCATLLVYSRWTPSFLNHTQANPELQIDTIQVILSDYLRYSEITASDWPSQFKNSTDGISFTSSMYPFGTGKMMLRFRDRLDFEQGRECFLYRLVQWNSQTNKCKDYHGYKQRMGHITRSNRLDKSLLDSAHMHRISSLTRLTRSAITNWYQSVRLSSPTYAEAHEENISMCRKSLRKGRPCPGWSSKRQSMKGQICCKCLSRHTRHSSWTRKKEARQRGPKNPPFAEKCTCLALRSAPVEPPL